MSQQEFDAACDMLLQDQEKDDPEAEKPSKSVDLETALEIVRKKKRDKILKDVGKAAKQFAGDPSTALDRLILFVV